MKKTTFNILFLSLIVFVNNMSLNFAVNNKSENLLNAFSLIVRDNFVQSSRQLFLLTSFDRSSNKSFFASNDIINHVSRNISGSYVTYRVLHNKQKVFFNLKHNEIVLLDSVKTFSRFYSKIKHIGNLDLSRTVLFISSLTTLDYDTIYMLFKDLHFMEIITVALVVKLANDDIVMLTYFPFTNESCRDFKPVIINRFLADQQRWEADKYFPKKLDNFYGCPIYWCTWEDMPYFGVKRNTENNSIEDYEGIEAEALKYLAESLNFSVIIRWIDPVNADLETEETFSAELLLQQCDLAVGGFIYRKDFDTTAFSQTQSSLFSHIYIVTNVIKFYTTYEKLAFPFHYTVWFALGLTFILSFLLICTCGQRRQWTEYRNFLIGSANSTPTFHLYGLAVGASMTTTHMPKRNFARFLITCWLLLTFVLRVAYQSGMYQMLRDNRLWNPPQTIENLFEQNYVISITPKYHKYLELLPRTQRVRVFNSTILEAFEEMLNAKEPIALVIPFEYYGYLGKINKTRFENLHLVKERLLTQQLTMYSPHHSFLVPALNLKLLYGQFHGFSTLWKRKNILSTSTVLRYDQVTENQRSNDKNSNNATLAMNELGAIFMILIWLHVLAIVCFLTEVIWHRFPNSNRSSLFLVKD